MFLPPFVSRPAAVLHTGGKRLAAHSLPAAAPASRLHSPPAAPPPAAGSTGTAYRSCATPHAKKCACLPAGSPATAVQAGPPAIPAAPPGHSAAPTARPAGRWAAAGAAAHAALLRAAAPRPPVAALCGGVCAWRAPAADPSGRRHRRRRTAATGSRHRQGRPWAGTQSRPAPSAPG